MGSTETSTYEPGEASELPPPPALPVETGWKSLDGLTKAAIITCTLMVVTFIAPPVGFVFGLASIGFSAGALVAARRDGRRNGSAFNTLMVSSIAVAILIAGSFLLIDGGSSGVVIGEAIPIPAGAPDADVFVSLESIGRSGPRETAAIADSIDENQIDGTVVHVTNAVSELGTTGIYRWSSLQALSASGEPEQLSCIGSLPISLTASSGCGYWDEPLAAGVDPTNVSWGDTSDGDVGTYNVMIWNASSDGVWMLVETETGSKIVSNIVDGVGYVDYQDKYGPTTLVSVYDANYELIWSNTIS